MQNLPSGTVTFLFTDIEGSTQLWERYPDQARAALARHDTLLREAIEGNTGYIFKTVGDAFCAAFSTPLAALASALQAQRALQEEKWGEIGAVRVRIALHTGVTVEREGDYFGPSVNRVARLLSAGHGGQTLLSEITYGLTRDSLPSGLGVKDLGEHRLKDLTRPEHVFQLVIPGLPTEFPPLRTLATHPNNLPLQPTALIGREKEVQEVKGRLLREDVRLLTLMGPGGTGKTRLALQVAADLLEEFGDGVFFVNLAPITGAGLVASEIAQTLGVRESGGQPLEESLKAYLKDKQVLLVLDNFEQVVEAAPALTRLLAAALRLKMLVTSRTKLQVRGEYEYAVPPLLMPDLGRLPPIERLIQYEAVRLFVERAQAARPDFQITDDNAPAVAEICHRLDGLPLTIELAAARLKILPPQAMLVRLQSRLNLLTGGSRDLPARQQTLRGTIEWSYDLLDEEESKLFRRLAVFVGSRSLEAIEAVCNAEADLGIDVLDGVQSLVDKSLLRQEAGVGGEPRFAMLGTIHEYARAKLHESGEEEALQREHALYFAEFVEDAERQWKGAKQEIWLDRIEEEHDNLRAALRWAREASDAGAVEIGLRLAGALWWFWYVRGYFAEGREHLSSLLSKTVQYSMPKELEAKALNAAGSLASEQGEYEAARLLLEKCLALRRELGDKIGISQVLNNLGVALFRQDHYDAAAKMYEESLAIRRELGDRWGMAAPLWNLASIAYVKGDYDSAHSLHSEALAIRRQLGDKVGAAWSLNSLGNLAHESGEHRTAGALYSEALAIRRELGDKWGIGTSLVGLGGLAVSLGHKGEIRQVRQGVRMLGAAEVLLEAIGTGLNKDDRAVYERSVALARTCLGDEEYENARQEGRAMTMHEAIACALDEAPHA